MGFHRGQCHVQRLGYLGVVVPLGDRDDDVVLARAERGEGGLGAGEGTGLDGDPVHQAAGDLG